MSTHPSPRKRMAHGHDTDITVTVDPARHTHTVLALAARLPYLVSIAGPRPADGPDPLTTEDAEELLTLIGELSDIDQAVQELLSRVVAAVTAAHPEVSDSRLARSMGCAVTTAQRARARAREEHGADMATDENVVNVNGAKYRLPADLAELRKDNPSLVHYLDPSKRDSGDVRENLLADLSLSLPAPMSVDDAVMRLRAINDRARREYADWTGEVLARELKQRGVNLTERAGVWWVDPDEIRDLFITWNWK